MMQKSYFIFYFLREPNLRKPMKTPFGLNFAPFTPLMRSKRNNCLFSVYDQFIAVIFSGFSFLYAGDVWFGMKAQLLDVIDNFRRRFISGLSCVFWWFNDAFIGSLRGSRWEILRLIKYLMSSKTHGI